MSKLTYEEALEQVAMERGCKADDLVACGEGGVGECKATTCSRVRQLMAGVFVPEPSSPELVQLPSGDVVAAQPSEPLQLKDFAGFNSANPKTLMGSMKVPNLSVVPFTGLIHEARAMEYGARHAPRKDGSKGYGPFNWRDQKIEYLIYAEAAIRHIASAVDREDIDPDTGDLKVWHLGLAKATLGILIDAIEHGTVIDDRSPTARGRVAQLLRELRKTS